MKFIKYLVIGIIFGIVLTKAEIVSWFRIFEMFKFQAFHMYGVIGSAVILGAIFVAIIKRTRMKDIDGVDIELASKDYSIPRYIIGGIIFGLGWALTGACPGPLFILVGNGVTVILVVLAAALLGTYAYGMLRKHLPH